MVLVEYYLSTQLYTRVPGRVPNGPTSQVLEGEPFGGSGLMSLTRLG